MATTASSSGTFKIGGDLEVTRLGYGAMRIVGDGVWGPPKDHDEAIAVLRRAVELGITFFDTADSYGPVVAEKLLAEALHPYPDDVVIATKAGLTRQGPGVWTPVGVPAYLRQQAELSLRRLKVQAIDLFQLHRIDPATVKAELTAAGFRFEEASDALRNPADNHTLGIGDPSLRGHTDRFIMKFTKP